MSRKMWAVVISMIAFFVSASNAAVVFGPIESPVNGHFYSVLSNSNWTDAEAASEQMGGSLATIRSAAEQTWISQTFSAYPYLWLGLYDPTQQDVTGTAHANNFKWADGETTTYRNWDSGEPNNFNGGEYWTQLVLTNSSTVSQGKWNDMYNDANPTHYPNSYGPDYGLAEIVPEPVSIGCVSLCALMLSSLRRTRRVRPTA